MRVNPAGLLLIVLVPFYPFVAFGSPTLVLDIDSIVVHNDSTGAIYMRLSGGFIQPSQDNTRILKKYLELSMQGKQDTRKPQSGGQLSENIVPEKTKKPPWFSVKPVKIQEAKRRYILKASYRGVVPHDQSFRIGITARILGAWGVTDIQLCPGRTGSRPFCVYSRNHLRENGNCPGNSRATRHNFYSGEDK